MAEVWHLSGCGSSLNSAIRSSGPVRELGKEGLEGAISRSDSPAGRSALRLEPTPEREDTLGEKLSGLPGLARSRGAPISDTLQFDHPLQESLEGIRLGLGSPEAVSSL